MSDTVDSSQEATVFNVPEELRQEAVRASLTGERPRGAIVRALRDRVEEKLGNGDYEDALGELREGRFVLTQEAVQEAVERNVQDVEENDSEEVRKRVGNFATGLVILRSMSIEDRKRIIEQVLGVAGGDPGEVSNEIERKYQLPSNYITEFIGPFLDKTVELLKNTEYIRLEATRQNKLPELVAIEIIVDNFPNEAVLGDIQNKLIEALEEQVDYSKLRDLEQQERTLREEVEGYKKRLKKLAEDIKEAHKIARELSEPGKTIELVREVDGKREINPLGVEAAIRRLEKEIKETEDNIRYSEGRENISGQTDVSQEVEEKRKKLRELKRKLKIIQNFERNVQELGELKEEQKVKEMKEKEERLRQVESELRAERERVKQQRKQYEEEVYKSSVKGLGSYAERVRDAVFSVEFSEEEQFIRNRILEKVRNRFKSKDAHEYILKHLLDPNQSFEDKVQQILYSSGVVESGGLNLNETFIEAFPQDLRDICKDIFSNKEFRESIFRDVVLEALTKIVYDNPKALEGALSRDQAAALAFSNDVVLELINAARDRAETARERLKQLEEQGLIKKGTWERFTGFLKSAGGWIKEHKLFSGSAVTAIIIALILFGILPPLAAWPAGIASAAEGVGEKIIGW